VHVLDVTVDDRVEAGCQFSWDATLMPLKHNMTFGYIAAVVPAGNACIPQSDFPVIGGDTS
jgi:hypothetical protein